MKNFITLSAILFNLSYAANDTEWPRQPQHLCQKPKVLGGRVAKLEKYSQLDYRRQKFLLSQNKQLQAQLTELLATQKTTHALVLSLQEQLQKLTNPK